jgi:hypothetical protein
MPMQCRPMKIAVATERGLETVHAIVCSRTDTRKRCVVCQSSRDLRLCDFPLQGGKAGRTCDRPVCGAHATHEAPDTDYCPSHAGTTPGRPVAPL